MASIPIWTDDRFHGRLICTSTDESCAGQCLRRQDTPDRAGLGVLLVVFCIVLVAASVAFAAVWVSGVNPSTAPCQVGGQTVTRTTVSTFPIEDCS